MSSAGAPTAAAAPQRYFCHQCDRTISLTPSPTGELSCPICNGGFIEEFDIPNPNSNPSPLFSFHSSDPLFSSSSSSSSALPFLFSTPSSLDLRNPSDLAGIFAPSSPTTFRSLSPAGPEPFNPLLFLQNYFQTLMADGTNIQFVLEGGGGGHFGGNLGDYFVGPGLEQFIQQLAENDPNRYGTPPAAKSAIESLPEVKVDQDLIGSGDEAQCAVCKDAFEIGAEAKQMPCKHIYHKDCILPWLELHNSCPVCRYELPTDDPDFERRPRGASASEERVTGVGDSGGVGVAAAAGGGNSPRPRTVERRFRISLPWPLGAMGMGSPAETSNAGDGGNNGGSGEGRDGDSGGQGNFGSETRQEDLD